MRTLPAAFCDAMRPLLGEEYPAFLHAMEQEPPYRGLRVNPRRVDPAIFAAHAPFALTPSPLCPEGFRIDPDCPAGKDPLHAAGVYYLQEPAAQHAALVMPITPGMRVLDLCAAPGGKSTHLAAHLAETGGFLAANECVADRAKVLASNLERMGADNACVLSAMPDELAKAAYERFDGVLVDAPCSGEGMFRREPRAIPEWNPAHARSCAHRQGLILDAAAALTAPGGCIVYSTCTLNPLENEGVCAAFLQRHPGWTLENADPENVLPHGRADWLDTVDPDVPEEIRTQMGYTIRLMPHKTPGEGHFIARLRKSSMIHDPLPENAKTLPENGLRLPDAAEQAAFSALWRELTDLPEPEHLRVRGEYVYIVRPEADDLPAMVSPGVQAAHICRNRGEESLQRQLDRWNRGTDRRKSPKAQLRMEPAHQLAMVYGADFARSVSLTAESPALAAYFRGESVPCDSALSGWAAVLLDTLMGRFPLGLCKCSGGQAKNHLPKGLRV